MRASQDPRLWVVSLAGGDGTRLTSLTTALNGEPVPVLRELEPYAI